MKLFWMGQLLLSGKLAHQEGAGQAQPADACKISLHFNLEKPMRHEVEIERHAALWLG